MGTLINLYAGATGLWKKIAALLPLILGLSSLLAGLAGFCSEIGHAANVAAILAIFQNIQADPNSALVLAGLGALGIHTNHVGNQAALADHADVLNQVQQVLPPQPQSKP